MDIKAHFKDKYHDYDIVIKNIKKDSNCWELSFTVDDIDFVGSNLNDFELKNEKDYKKAKEKFMIKKVTTEKDKFYYLQRYEMTFEIPVTVIERKNNICHQGIIKYKYIMKEHKSEHYQVIMYCDEKQVFLDDVECLEFALIVDDMYYSADKKSTDFETSLKQIYRACNDRYLLKCCFMCQYSDYSPYGNDDFGTMLCYKKHKDIYLTVNDKDEFFEKLYDLDFDTQQETNICKEFDERLKCEGYRGKIV